MSVKDRKFDKDDLVALSEKACKYQCDQFKGMVGLVLSYKYDNMAGQGSYKVKFGTAVADCKPIQLIRSAHKSNRQLVLETIKVKKRKIGELKLAIVAEEKKIKFMDDMGIDTYDAAFVQAMSLIAELNSGNLTDSQRALMIVEFNIQSVKEQCGL